MYKLTSLENLENQDKALLLKILAAIKSIDYGPMHLTMNDCRVGPIKKTHEIRVKASRDCVCS